MKLATAFSAAALALAAAALYLVWDGRASAGALKPALDVTFGPQQVEAGERSDFLLVLRNSGFAESKLTLGDAVEVRYGTLGEAADLLAVEGRLTPVDPLPAGIEVHAIETGDLREIGVRFSVTGELTIAPGAARAFHLTGPAASLGAAPVNLTMTFGKLAGKSAKTLAVTVVKTPPVAQADFYGDGSDGSPTITDGAALQALSNYVNVFIPQGATVTVPSGTTIRCTGFFENRGVIVVGPGCKGGGVPLSTPNVPSRFESPSVVVERGDALSAARVPSILLTEPVLGALGGLGLGTAVYSLPLSHYRRGGGGGTGTLSAIGGDGGGVFRVIARGPAANGGTILAQGAAPTFNRSGLIGGAGGGAGGGGGGIVILASGTVVTNSAPANERGSLNPGNIDVSGGPGGTADPFGGGGGGGGGGLVVFCAPSVPEAGTTNLLGGLSAYQSLTTTEVLWAGGGGGGACVGSGGSGSPVREGGNVGPPPGGTEDPEPAQPGQLIVRTADPRTLWQ